MDSGTVRASELLIDQEDDRGHVSTGWSPPMTSWSPVSLTEPNSHPHPHPPCSSPPPERTAGQGWKMDVFAAARSETYAEYMHVEMGVYLSTLATLAHRTTPSCTWSLPADGDRDRTRLRVRQRSLLRLSWPGLDLVRSAAALVLSSLATLSAAPARPRLRLGLAALAALA